MAILSSWVRLGIRVSILALPPSDLSLSWKKVFLLEVLFLLFPRLLGLFSFPCRVLSFFLKNVRHQHRKLCLSFNKHKCAETRGKKYFLIFH